MSFSQGFFFHEHLLPVWDSNIKHNGFLPLSSPAPLCGSFHSQTLFSVLRLKFPSGCRRRARELAVPITMSLARRFSRRERWHVRDRALQNVLLVFFFFATYQSWRGACQELHVATLKYKSRSTRQFPMVDLLYGKKKNPEENKRGKEMPRVLLLVRVTFKEAGFDIYIDFPSWEERLRVLQGNWTVVWRVFKNHTYLERKPPAKRSKEGKGEAW